MTSGKISFQPRARLLKIIGEELISDEVVAIVELVKNAYDADASRVIVEFNCSSEEDASIEIRDDGHGMSRQLLLDGWMHPAASTKRGDRPRRTRSGRRLLGEKGVGRFAADKLGSQLQIVSRARRQKEISATFEWDRYEDENAMLSDITNHWEERPRYRDIREHGTILRITGLRARWTERLYRKVALKLARLRSPSLDHSGFAIDVRSDVFPDYSEEINRDFLLASPYSIEANYDGSGQLTFSLKDRKLERIPWSGGGAIPRCGPVRIRIHAFDLETESVAKVGPVPEVRAWLRQWSGISVYRDGYRVYPYGEPNDDWLRLDQRRVNNPVVRLSNNQVAGFVEINRDSNPELLDKTNREGLRGNTGFEDLRRVVHASLQRLEAERQIFRSQRNGSVKIRTPEEAGTDPLDQLEEMIATRKKPTPTYLRSILLQLREKERIAGTIRTSLADLAGTGVVASKSLETYSHLQEEVQEDLEKIKEFLSGTNSRNARRAIRSLENSMQRIEKVLESSGLLENTGKQRSVDLLKEVQQCAREALADRIDGKKLVCHIQRKGRQLPRAHLPALTIRRALFVVLENAIEASPRRQRIDITLVTDGDRVRIRVKDRGKGIAVRDRDHVFEPGFSRKGKNGMGLTVAREILRPVGGMMRIATHANQKKGTTIEIVLPRKQSRATRNSR